MRPSQYRRQNRMSRATEDGIDNLSTSLGIELNDLSATVADTYKTVLEKIGAQLQTVLAPLFGLFGALFSEKTTPGDKLDTNVKLMQAQISQLKAPESRSHGAGFLEDYTPGTDLDARGEPKPLHQLTEAVATMQASTRSMQDQLASERVKVGKVNSSHDRSP